MVKQKKPNLHASAQAVGTTHDPNNKPSATGRWFKRARQKLRWRVTALGPWIAYQRQRASFKRLCRQVGPDHVTRIDKPVGSVDRHVYEIAGDGQLTSFQLHRRWLTISKLYPERLTSLLDIGCCRGWFVLQAAQRPECERAVGVDVLSRFIDEANRAKAVLDLDHVIFDYAFLNDLVDNPEKYHTPAQTILLLNVYHYMYWGSEYSSNHWPDHEFLLGTLAELCTDRVIFMGPLEVVDATGTIKRRAAEHPEWAEHYNAAAFFSAAKKYFNVSFHGHLGTRPLYLMRKR